MEVAFKDYENYLTKKQIVPQIKIPYYKSWVNRCLSKCHKQPGDELTTREIENFLIYLSKRNEDWQVQQAADAIRIYNFYSKTKEKPNVIETPDIREQWRSAAKEMKKMLRLKQRKETTEKAYLYWLRHFYRYMKGLSPLTLDTTHVKNFLSYIAVEKRISKSSQNQAFNAILFFFRHVLEKDLDDL